MFKLFEYIQITLSNAIIAKLPFLFLGFPESHSWMQRSSAPKKIHVSPTLRHMNTNNYCFLSVYNIVQDKIDTRNDMTLVFLYSLFGII